MTSAVEAEPEVGTTSGVFDEDSPSEEEQDQDTPTKAPLPSSFSSKEASKEDAPTAATPDVSQAKAALTTFLRDFDWRDLFDRDKPWVLVPNGSFLGVFDFVPPVFRVGPWAPLPCFFLVATLYLVLLGGVYNYATDNNNNTTTIELLPNDYYDALTMPWYLNLAGFLWTSYVFRDLFVSGMGWAAMTTFTVQSYAYISLRLGLSTLVPFLPTPFATLNECLRYPILSQATITFVVWNFILFPVIFGCIQDPSKRTAFLRYFTNFRLLQLHFFHVFLAIYSGVWGTPPRALRWTDLYASVGLGLVYCLFYILVLDRLGLHFYMIFSPRTNLSIPSWSLVIASTMGLYPLWSQCILKYGGLWWEQDDDVIAQD